MKKKVKPYEILYDILHLTLDMVERVVAEEEQLVLKSYIKNTMHAFERTIQQAGEGKPIAGFHFAFSGDILNAFDVAPFCIEAIPYLLSSLMPNGAEYFYDKVHAWGHPYHACTSQKGIMGMLLEGLIDFDFMVCSSSPCDNTVSSYQFFSNQMKIPLFIADMPQSKTDRGYEYFAGELMRQINGISELIRQEPDLEKFRTAVEINRQAQEYLIEINELRRRVPSPIESVVNPVITATTIFLPGMPEKAQIFRDILELMRKRVKHNEMRPGYERIRSIWPNIAFFFDIGFYEWIDRELGMSFLMDCTTHYHFDLLDPRQKRMEEILYEFAKQAMNSPMTRQSLHFLETLIEDTLWAAKTYRADCGIFVSHLGCKQVNSALQIVREALRDELGIPMLTIECDIGDKRFTSIDTIKYEVSEFVKTLL